MVRWRAVWVLAPSVEHPTDVGASVRAAARPLGISICIASLEQRHVVVEFELSPHRDGEAAAHLLKAHAGAQLDRSGSHPGRWWRDGLFLTRV